MNYKKIGISIIMIFCIITGNSQQQRTQTVKPQVKGQQEKKQDDRYNIIVTIKERLSKWLEKDEFETTAEYQKRLQDLTKSKFKEISADVVDEYLDKTFHFISHGRLPTGEWWTEGTNYMRITASEYDADNEILPISCRIGGVRGRGNEITFNTDLHVSRKDAPELKQDIKSGNHAISGYKNDWCFVDNYLYPIEMTLRLSTSEYLYYFDDTKWKKYKITTSIKMTHPIQFSISDLNLNNKNIDNYTFDYHDYLKIMIPQYYFEKAIYRAHKYGYLKKIIPQYSFEKATYNVSRYDDYNTDYDGYYGDTNISLFRQAVEEAVRFNNVEIEKKVYDCIIDLKKDIGNIDDNYIESIVNAVSAIDSTNIRVYLFQAAYFLSEGKHTKAMDLYKEIIERANVMGNDSILEEAPAELKNMYYEQYEKN